MIYVKRNDLSISEVLLSKIVRCFDTLILYCYSVVCTFPLKKEKKMVLLFVPCPLTEGIIPINVIVSVCAESV